jgi:uncharacterized membrane protein YeaQ/YmgE (transglycosylase-associated protein family)
MGILWGIIVMIIGGAIVGWIADAIVPGDVASGFWATAALGIVGSLLAGFLFGSLGNFGPEIGQISIIPGIIGAVILAFIVRWVMGRSGRRI